MEQGPNHNKPEADSGVPAGLGPRLNGVTRGSGGPKASTSFPSSRSAAPRSPGSGRGTSS